MVTHQSMSLQPVLARSSLTMTTLRASLHCHSARRTFLLQRSYLFVLLSAYTHCSWVTVHIDGDGPFRVFYTKNRARFEAWPLSDYGMVVHEPTLDSRRGPCCSIIYDAEYCDVQISQLGYCAVVFRTVHLQLGALLLPRYVPLHTSTFRVNAVLACTSYQSCVYACGSFDTFRATQLTRGPCRG